MSRITKALLAAALLALALPAGASAAPTLQPVGSFSQPIHVTGPPGDASRVFVVERGGTVRLIKNGVTQSTPFLTVSGVLATGDEQGLLSIAFPPDYGTSGLFYVYFTSAPGGDLTIREYRRSSNPDVADAASGRPVWSTPHPDAANHNGGQVAFGPDGMLWFATGDGGGSDNQFGHARDLGSQLGKLLRIDPRPTSTATYTVPADNPFGTAIWSYGLRNPFRFSFDRATGDLWIGDVGQTAREEIDWVRNAEGLGRGTDYEWSCREGFNAGPTACTPAALHTPPVFDYVQGSPRAVTGGVRVRDPGLPTLLGLYLWADFYAGDIHALFPARPRAAFRTTGLRTPLIASFGEDACGHVYVVSYDGPVYRIQDGAIGPCVPVTAPPGGGPPTAPANPDRSSPTIRVRVARKGRVGRRAQARILVTVSENARVTINARLAKSNLKRVRTPLRANRRTTIRLRPKARAIERINRALRRHKRVTMTVKIVAVDAAGNTGRLTKRLKVRRG